MTNPLEGWQDIVIPPPKTSREWLQRACGIKADITKWKFTSEEVVTCLSRYAREQNKAIKKENETLKMCASAGEAMGVEMLRLETQKEQYLKDIKLLREAAKGYCYCNLIPRYKNKLNPNEKCVSCEALAATDKPEYRGDDNVVT